jgi:predicted flap endonuclease-1-like 5' DNA nuclease
MAASSLETESPAKPDARTDFQNPADALRAKRDASARTRQELLATLRRNSEAVQRGQFPLPENANTRSEQPPVSPPTRSTSLVSALPPDEQDVSAPSASVAMEQPPKSIAPSMPPERLRWINNPELTQRTKQYPDDLSKIKGIGDVYKQRLYRARIYTWKQIADTDPEILRRAVSANQSSNIGEWHDQAVKLMEKHGRMDAVYEGPQPDDMTKILGIGPVSASVLYRSGICTYEQLASTPLADLDALFPIAVAGDQPDFAQWVARATELADQKHRDR